MKSAPTLQQPEYNVEFVKASDLNGEPFYAYLLLPQALLETFREKLRSGESDIELEKFGVVLVSGKGHVPSQEHVDYINQRFGR